MNLIGNNQSVPTGGIIALAASLKIPMSDVVNFYQEYGPSIFNENVKHRPDGRAYLRSKQIALGGKYSAKPLRSALEIVFGNRTIAESNNFLFIPAYNTLTANPRVFKKTLIILQRMTAKVMLMLHWQLRLLQHISLLWKLKTINL